MHDSQYLMIHHFQYQQKQKEMKTEMKMKRQKELENKIKRITELEKPKRVQFNPSISISSDIFSEFERKWFNKLSK